MLSSTLVIANAIDFFQHYHHPTVFLELFALGTYPWFVVSRSKSCPSPKSTLYATAITNHYSQIISSHIGQRGRLYDGLLLHTNADAENGVPPSPPLFIWLCHQGIYLSDSL